MIKLTNEHRDVRMKSFSSSLWTHVFPTVVTFLHLVLFFILILPQMQYETYKMGKTSDTSGSIERRRFGDVAGEAIESATAD